MTRALRRALAGTLGEGDAALLCSSFDQVGEIAIIRIPDPLLPRRREIGEAVLAQASGATRVFCQASDVSGEHRTRSLELIAGEGGTVTVHREHGCAMLVDVEGAFFSPRLATERARIASLASDGETVLNMFGAAAREVCGVFGHCRVRDAPRRDNPLLFARPRRLEGPRGAKRRARAPRHCAARDGSFAVPHSAPRRPALLPDCRRRGPAGLVALVLVVHWDHDRGYLARRGHRVAYPRYGPEHAAGDHEHGELHDYGAPLGEHEEVRVHKERRYAQRKYGHAQRAPPVHARAGAAGGIY